MEQGVLETISFLRNKEHAILYSMWDSSFGQTIPCAQWKLLLEQAEHKC